MAKIEDDGEKERKRLVGLSSVTKQKSPEIKKKKKLGECRKKVESNFYFDPLGARNLQSWEVNGFGKLGVTEQRKVRFVKCGRSAGVWFETSSVKRKEGGRKVLRQKCFA